MAASDQDRQYNWLQYGRGYDESKENVQIRHPGYFAYVFGRKILLRAADFATKEWLPMYDQLVTLD